MIKQLFIYILKQSCDRWSVKVDDKFDTLINDMKDNENVFKSKMIYEYFNLNKVDENIESDKNIAPNTEPTKFYYVQKFKLKDD